MKTTVVSIDTGNPNIEASTTAIVRMEFDGTSVRRTAIVYSGSFSSCTSEVLRMCTGADFVVVEKIDATNKYLDRAIVAEQIEIVNLLRSVGIPVHELVRSGRKEVITDGLMKMISLWSEGDHKTHHNDVREATRNGLYFMAKNEQLNEILSKYVQRFF